MTCNTHLQEHLQESQAVQWLCFANDLWPVHVSFLTSSLPPPPPSPCPLSCFCLLANCPLPVILICPVQQGEIAAPDFDADKHITNVKKNECKHKSSTIIWLLLHENLKEINFVYSQPANDCNQSVCLFLFLQKSCCFRNLARF
jgi:hypothetical protein